MTEENHGEYKCEMLLNGRKIYFRKWKVKDRIALNKAETQSDMRQCLVYNCLEDKKIILDDFEYQYVLIKLRQASIGDNIIYDFTCTKCQKRFKYVSNLSETIEPIDASYAPITVGNICFEMGAISNRNLYETELFSVTDLTARKIVDFAMHVKAINQNRTYSFKDVMNIITELDVDDFQEIWAQWSQMHFRLNRLHNVTCPHCQHKMLIEFDDLPGFFPEKWNMQ